MKLYIFIRLLKVFVVPTKARITNPRQQGDKTLMEKLRVLELLEDEEKNSVYHIIDGLFAEKKLKDTLSSALNSAV